MVKVSAEVGGIGQTSCWSDWDCPEDEARSDPASQGVEFTQGCTCVLFHAIDDGVRAWLEREELQSQSTLQQALHQSSRFISFGFKVIERVEKCL